MTRDELVRLANLAGITGPGSPRQAYRMFASPEKLEKFAWLIARHERRECVFLCEMIAAQAGSATDCADAIARKDGKKESLDG